MDAVEESSHGVEESSHGWGFFFHDIPRASPPMPHMKGVGLKYFPFSHSLLRFPPSAFRPFHAAHLVIWYKKEAGGSLGGRLLRECVFG